MKLAEHPDPDLQRVFQNRGAAKAGHSVHWKNTALSGEKTKFVVGSRLSSGWWRGCICKYFLISLYNRFFIWYVDMYYMINVDDILEKLYICSACNDIWQYIGHLATNQKSSSNTNSNNNNDNTNSNNNNNNNNDTAKWLHPIATFRRREFCNHLPPAKEFLPDGSGGSGLGPFLWKETCRFWYLVSTNSNWLDVFSQTFVTVGSWDVQTIKN